MRGARRRAALRSRSSWTRGGGSPGSGSGPNPRDVNSRLFLEVLKAIAIAVPRTGIDEEVVEAVVQDGHPQLRDRGFARRVHRITVRGSEIPDRPTPDVHVKGARPRSRDAGRVSGRGPIPEMEVREWKPGILFHVVDERLDGSRPAQHHRDDANRYDKSPRAAHDPSPRSRGRRPHAPCEFRMRGPAI